MSKPIPKFNLNQSVKVPTQVCDSGKGVVKGWEWGPDNGRLKIDRSGWVYYLAFDNSREGFRVAEAELLEWQR